MAKNKIKLISWDESFPRILREKGLGSKFVTGYLNEALNDPEPKILAIAIKHIIKASSLTFEEIAKKSGVGIRTIFRIAKREGNPTLGSMNKILKALGFTVKFTAVREKKKVA